MDGSEQQEWTEGPILPEVPAPPVDRIVLRGARLVRIYDAPSEAPKPDGGREAVIIAWARMPDGWAILLAWTSYARVRQHGTALARYGWYAFDEQRIKPHRPPQMAFEGAAWHGWHEDSELNVAIRQAALLLPPEMRERAMTPAPDPE